jgi:hypothetical protein
MWPLSQTSEWLAVASHREGRSALLVKGYRGSVLKDEKFWGWMVVMVAAQ